MKQFYLTEIVTQDNLIHQGIYFEPKRKGKLAILWVHGLTDTFYGDGPTFEEFVKYCEKRRWAFASFNTRGHDIISSISKLDHSIPKGRTSVVAGAAAEKFVDCIHDIDAAISFLEHKGFNQIILVGHSTGANKVCYYQATKQDRRVVAVVLASPLSDVAVARKKLRNEYEKKLKEAEKLVKNGNGDTFQEGFDSVPMTPNRFLSLATPGSDEDVFPYYNQHAKFAIYSNVTTPVLVVMGGVDEYADRSVQDIIQVYDEHHKSRNYKSVIIPYAFHGFGGQEKEFVGAIMEWARTFR